MIRFPNTDDYVKANINMAEFKQDKEFDNEVFGWYRGQYVAIKK